MVDAWGRERWGRSNWQQKLVELVEPDPNGSGAVATNGMITTYSYDIVGNLTTIVQGDQTRSFKYDSQGRVIAQKLAETSAAINNSGTYVGVGGSGAQWSNYVRYDSKGHVVQILDARGVKSNFWYFNPSGHTDPGDGTAPDPLGRLQAVSYDTTLDPYYSLSPGQTNYYLKVLDAPTVTYTYRTKSSGGELKDISQVASITTAGVSTASYNYDPTDGRLLSRTLTLNSRTSYPFTVNYTYDSLDRVSDVQYPNEWGQGSARRWLHRDVDVAGRLTNLTFDGQSHASNFVYNAGSQMTLMKVGVSGANQITENYSFNPDTQFLDSQTVVRGATTLLNYAYNFTGANGKRTGQLVSITDNLDNNKNRKYEYDAVGRLKRAMGGQNVNWMQRYEYDRYGNRYNAFSFTAEQYVRNFYQNALNRQPTSTELQSRLSTLQSAFTQGPTQFLTAMQTLGSDIFTSTEYNEPSNEEYVKDLYRSYLFREPDSGGLAFWIGVCATNGREAVRAGFAWSIEFDVKVSGISPNSPAGGATVLADGLQGLGYETATNHVWNAGWAYDALGNQVRTELAPGSWQVYQYDAANRLKRVLQDDKVTERTAYTYGHDSQRLINYQPSLSGGQGQRTYYVTEGGAAIAEYTESGSGIVPTWSKSCVYLGARLISSVTPNGGGLAIEYHHPDRLGTRLITNGQNTSSFTRATLPFGTTLDAEDTGTGTTSRKFTSYDRSTTTQLDYAVNRHYDPQQGRFTQVDPLGMKATTIGNPQSLNLYSYCENDPINNTDPSGLGFFSFLKKIFKAIVKVLTNKWVMIALSIAAAVISIGVAAFGWKLLTPVFTNIGADSAPIWIFEGFKATALGWVNTIIQAALTVTNIGFSGKQILRNILSFAASTASGRVLSVLSGGSTTGPGGTPPFAFISGVPLTRAQGDIVWNALMVAIDALKRDSCRKFVGVNAAATLRQLWDERRITYFNGKAFSDKNPLGAWATTTRPGWFGRNPSKIVTSYNFFDDKYVAWDANRQGITSIQQRAATLLHEVRHVLCYDCNYAEPHDDENKTWDKAIIANCFK